jgi:protein-glutamine gamma-glutamyltransferase
LPTEIHYRILMEPIGTNVFFLTPMANLLDGDYRLVAANAAGDVFNLDAEHVINAYRGVSDLAQPDAADLQLAYGPYPPQILEDNLQLPKLDPRIPQLAEQITDSLPSNYDRAAAIENYLRSHYGYTLQLSRTQPRDPLAEFLFVRKQGHCEYFASAMAVMLRSLHIPSRVVNGFRGGEYNDLSGQYVIRASDAHSWVEAYFPGYGWVGFDPTPAAPPLQQWGRAGLYLDALSSFWREWVVNYDSAHQGTLARDAAQGTGQWLTRTRQWGHRQYEALLGKARRTSSNIAREPKPWIFNAALFLILLFAVANGKKLWLMLRTWRWASRPEKAPAMAASIWYGRMIKRVGRRGWSKTAGQTPQEFARKIDDAGLRTRVENFTRSYESARFAESKDDAVRLPELYEEIVNSR